MNDYIQAIEKLLGQLTTAEQQDVVEYYREYLLDAGIETYQQAVDELGTPRSLARKVLADYSIRLSEREPKENADGLADCVGTVVDASHDSNLDCGSSLIICDGGRAGELGRCCDRNCV